MYTQKEQKKKTKKTVATAKCTQNVAFFLLLYIFLSLCRVYKTNAWQNVRLWHCMINVYAIIQFTFADLRFTFFFSRTKLQRYLLCPPPSIPGPIRVRVISFSQIIWLRLEFKMSQIYFLITHTTFLGVQINSLLTCQCGISNIAHCLQNNFVCLCVFSVRAVSNE